MHAGELEVDVELDVVVVGGIGVDVVEVMVGVIDVVDVLDVVVVNEEAIVGLHEQAEL